MDVQHLPSARLPIFERSKWRVFASFLALLTVFDTIHNYVAHRGDGSPISVALAIQFGISYWLPYFLLVPAAIFFVEKFPPDFQHMRSITMHGLAGLAFTYAHIVIAAVPDMAYRLVNLSYSGRFFLLLGEDFSIDYVLYCSITVAAYLMQRYSSLRQRELVASQLEASLAQAQLRSIQAQLKPHFFFNTLQAISGLALAGERELVVEMLSRLSDLIRESFDECRPAQISLAVEMQFMEGYLSLHQLTFGERLHVETCVAAETLHAMVPAMLLQPLVENAIIHGIAIKPGAGTIRVAAWRNSHELVLQVADSGCGFPTEGPTRSGVGLSATESRLRLLYPNAHHVEYGRSAESGASVTITIPFVASSPAKRVPSVEFN